MTENESKFIYYSFIILFWIVFFLMSFSFIPVFAAIAVIITLFIIAYLIITKDSRRDRRLQRQEEYKIMTEERVKREIQEKEEKLYQYQKLRKEIQQMPKYQTWREAVFSLYGRRCQICGEINNLEIHHIQSLYSILNTYKIDDVYKAFECAALWNIYNGTVICRSCHENMKSSQYHNEKINNY